MVVHKFCFFMIAVTSFAWHVLNNSFSSAKRCKLICLTLDKSSKHNNCGLLKFVTSQGSALRPCGLLMQLDLIQGQLTFHAWFPAWPFDIQLTVFTPQMNEVK